MKIIQICNHLFQGDGVSNCILTLKKLMSELGIDNTIAVRLIKGNSEADNVVIFDHVSELNLKETDIILYHFHGGGALNREIEDITNRKVMVYHNVTPPHFFYGIDNTSVMGCAEALMYAQRSRNSYLWAMVLSDFSRRDLLRYGWNKSKIVRIPLISSEYDKREIAIPKWWRADYLNILFVGRISPNKKIEDLIAFIDYFEKNVDPKCRLILIGGKTYKRYYDALIKYIDELGCHSVYFADFVSDMELEACYQRADVFLCMSEHEGFCLPIIEAMKANLPVVAYSSSAVEETVGNTGMLFPEKDFSVVSEMVQRVVEDKEFRREIIEIQKEHIAEICIEAFKDEFVNLIRLIRNTSDYTYHKSMIIPDDDSLKGTEGLGGEIVIYGAGKAGIFLLEQIKDRSMIVSFCDNALTNNGHDVPVFSHDECIERYGNATYIISVQKKQKEIIARLINSGVDGDSIRIYNLRENRIY